MTFNIGNQNAGTINNVDGDQHIHGGQHAVVQTGPALDALAALRLAVEAVPAAAEDVMTRAEVERIDAALQGETDRRQASAALERLTRRLQSIGALAAAGTALFEPLRRLAEWLGPLAGNVLAMLPG